MSASMETVDALNGGLIILHVPISIKFLRLFFQSLEASNYNLTSVIMGY